MKTWFTRLMAVMFVVSMIFTPQLGALATDGDLPSDSTNTELVDNNSGNIDTGDENQGDSDNGDGGDGEDATVDGSDSANGDAIENDMPDSTDGEDQASDVDASEESGDSDEVPADEGSTGDADGSDAAGDDVADTTDELKEDADSSDAATGDDSAIDDASETNVEKSSTTDADALTDGEDSDDEEQTDPPISATSTSPDYGFSSFAYADGKITMVLEFDAAFTLADAHTFTIEFRGEGPRDANLSSLAVNGSPVTDIPGTTTASAGMVPDSMPPRATLQINTSQGFSGPASLTLVLDVGFEWFECDVVPNDYTQDAYFMATLQNNDSRGFSLENPVPCEGAGQPVVDFMYYSLWDQELQIWFAFPESISAEHQITIAFPSNLQMGPGPYDIQVWNFELGVYRSIGIARVADGVITIDFLEFTGDIESTTLGIPAVLATECGPDDVTTTLEELEFVITPGGPVTLFIDSVVLCEGDPPTKTGTWEDDGGDPYILWTIDSGDLLGGGNIRDYYGGQTFSFDCSTLEITPVAGTSYLPSDVYCEDDEGFDLDFWSADPGGIARVRITIEAHPFTELGEGEVPPTSYINCAIAEQRTFEYASTQVEPVGYGYGGLACYELFLPELVGDTLTKTVSSATAKTGDTITYTIVAETTASRWSSIDLRDYLPAGFEVKNVTCTVEPARFALEDCYKIEEGILFSGANSILHPEDGYRVDSAPVKITLQITGVVTAKTGQIVNQACSERDPWINLPRVVGDPTVPGGGVICDTAIVTIVQPSTVTPSPSPSPTGTTTPTETATPATPGATPTSTAPADPDPTKGVTGLPSTGSGDTGRSTLFFTVIAASLLVAAAVGIRLKPRQE